MSRIPFLSPSKKCSRPAAPLNPTLRSLSVVVVSLLGLLLAACGGGSSSSFAGSSSGSSTSGSSGSSTSSGSGSNVIPLVVNSGPPALSEQNLSTFNIPQISVTICQPNTTTCATINNILVDTGSTGLRIFASVLAAAGLNLSPSTDPSNNQNTIAECLPFVDGYTWGPTATANIQLGGETASNVALNILDDNGSFVPSVPSGCTALTTDRSLNSPEDFSANGVIGVGLFAQDCGPACAGCALTCSSSNDLYYSCNGVTNTCTPVQVALTSQVQNPVSLFAVDNNGVILQLPSINSAGATSATGTLTFGIGTQANNALGSAFVLAADASGYFTTTYNGQALDSSFIDSGSNAYFFADSSITVCPTESPFYCPSSTLNLTAINEGHDPSGNVTGSTSNVSFQVVNLQKTNVAFFALPAAAGTAASSSGKDTLSNDFDFGVPFFYGRHVYTGIENTTGGVGGPVGPYFAY